ncbi:MAG: ABC transporter ATP-binding protein [Leptospira sp.]|nr:ABC transporter ATP-binding protein [Leptospira sp.]
MVRLHLKNVFKNYYGFTSPLKRILAGISFGFLGIDKKFLALKDISLDLNSGEIVGIIGRNGAGKSTLLKMISGVIGKDKGTIQVHGSVRALLELSVGFNSELSGEDNVYFNGLVWGYSPKEILNLSDSIFEFADLVPFKKNPLKNYSSGMAMRLGFSLATATRPDILIVDEALAVGDASFQQKCLNRIRKFKADGSLILVVSHDLSLITHFCDRVLLLEKGELVFDGTPKKALERYMLLLGGNLSADEDSLPFMNPDSKIQFKFSLLNEKEIKTKHLFVAEYSKLQIEFVSKENLEDLTIGFHIDDQKGVRVFGTNTYILGLKSMKVRAKEDQKITFSFPIHFQEGKYTIGISFHKGESHVDGSYFWGESIFDFEVERGSLPKFVGMSYLPTQVTWDRPNPK